MTLELIYDRDCPNIEAARAAILRAFAQAEIPPRWTEWERKAPETPAYARSYGSPTILIDGKDVAPAPNNGDSCRLYSDGNGSLTGVPPVESIVAGITGNAHLPRGGFSGLLAAVPTGGAFLLPIGGCPACWPAYAAFLSSAGLGFLLSERYLLPVAGLFLIVTLATLAWRASTRRGLRPFFLGLAGAVTALIGKFIWASDPVLYLGLGLLLAAAVWNAWPRRQTSSCPRCISLQPEPEEEQSQ